MEPKDEKYHVPPSDRLRAALESMSDNISDTLPRGWGYTLFLFSPMPEISSKTKETDDSTLYYISNLERADNVTLLKQWLERNVQ